jgi:hypothetical protein
VQNLCDWSKSTVVPTVTALATHRYGQKKKTSSESYDLSTGSYLSVPDTHQIRLVNQSIKGPTVDIFMYKNYQTKEALVNFISSLMQCITSQKWTNADSRPDRTEQLMSTRT